MPHIDKEDQKAIVKAAIQDWLDEKFKELGKWTFRGILAMFFAYIVYVYLVSLGWHK